MSQSSFKPESYTSVSPYLIVPDAAAVIRFAIDVFGAVEIRRFTDPESGRIMHAELRLDDSILMLGNAVEDVWPAAEAHLHVYVPDVDATYRKGLEFGATSLQEPVKKADADKRGGFKDAWGTSWWVATKVES
jgi:PhnB protein